MSKTYHIPSPGQESLPLCGRVLSRNTPLTQRNQATMETKVPGASEAVLASSRKPVKVCRHCQRTAGLLPPLAASRKVTSETDEESREDGEEFQEDGEES